MDKIFLTSFSIGLFISCILLGWFEVMTVGIVGVIITIISFAVLKFFDFLVEDIPNEFFLLVFICMAALSIMFTLFNFPKPLLAQENRKGEYRPGDEAERYRNIQRNLGPKTDRELEANVDKTFIPFSSWIGRIVSSVGLLLITACLHYFIFQQLSECLLQDV